jgi:acyl-CoA thioesterase-1
MLVQNFMLKVTVFHLIFLSFSLTCFARAKDETRVLIVGDSLTEGYGVPKTSAYPYQLELLLKKKHPGVRVINAGSSGSTTASAYTRLKWHLRSKPGVLVLALGGNDGLRGFKTAISKANLSKTIQLAKDNGIKVLLAGMKLPTNYGKAYRKSFEKIFDELAKEHKVKSIPFLLVGVGGVKKLNLPDGIHPNEEGHKIIANTVYKYLEPEL